MTRLTLALLLLAPALRPQSDELRPEITAHRLTREGSLVRAAGQVRVRIGSLLLTADAGSLNQETDEVEVTGHAKATLPARSDRNLIRYPGGAVVSDEEVVIAADRLSVKSGLLLRGRGNVRAVTAGSEVDADEIDVFLKIGDGQARGNVRVNGSVPERPGPRPFNPSRFFPPEIWK